MCGWYGILRNLTAIDIEFVLVDHIDFCAQMKHKSVELFGT